MKFFYIWIFLAFVFVAFSSKANAFQRIHLPLNVAVVQADAIIEARTTRVPQNFHPSGDSAEVEIKRVFKGSLKPGIFTIQLHSLHVMALGRLQLEKDYIFFLRSIGTETPKFEVMFDGTRLHTDADVRLIASAVELSPAWSQTQNGLSTLLTAGKFRIKAGEELNLWVGFKNTSNKSITFKYHDWPLETHTYASLDIKPETGDNIKAIPHPTLTQEEINDYFSKFPRSYEITLKPQEEHFFALPKINSAKPGWGYKEKLDFKYYPITKPGKYTITATMHHFLHDSLLIAGGLTVWMEDGMRPSSE